MVEDEENDFFKKLETLVHVISTKGINQIKKGEL